MNVYGFYSPVIVDLAGLKANRDKIPIFMDHDPTKIVGQTDSIAIDSSGVRLTGIITGEIEGDSVSAGIITHAKNGFEWQASIGASIVRQEFLKAGEKAVVNGREITGPHLIARESRLFETSFVALGADSQTSASVAASNSLEPSKGGTMFEQWLQAKGFDPAALNETQRASWQSVYDAEQARASGNNGNGHQVNAENRPTRALEQIVEARRLEDARIDAITALAEQAIEERPMLLNEINALGQAAMESKSTVQEFELQLHRLLRKIVSPAPYAKTGSGSREQRRDMPKMVEASICLSGGLKGVDGFYKAETIEAAEKTFPHGMGLQDLLALAARENGYSGYSRNDIRGLLRAAFNTEGRTIRAEGFSTLSLPGILSNVANKFLLQGFNAVESGWQEISSYRNVRDFKTVTGYSLTGAMKYEQIGPGGEIKHGTLSELGYTIKADTYGKMFAITRQDIINDDLSALTSVPTKLGRGAALKINEVFWSTFLGTVGSFFTSGRGNYISGGTSALSSAALNLATQKFRKQTDPDGNPLGIMPKILVVPPELELTARELMSSMFVNTGGSSTTDKVPNTNVWNNLYQVVVSSYLSNTTITGNSTTAWYLLADPADLAVIEAAFLNGRTEPVVETADADFDVLGIQMRGYHDFGFGLQEYRAGVRSAGV